MALVLQVAVRSEEPYKLQGYSILKSLSAPDYISDPDATGELALVLSTATRNNCCIAHFSCASARHLRHKHIFQKAILTRTSSSALLWRASDQCLTTAGCLTSDCAVLTPHLATDTGALVYHCISQKLIASTMTFSLSWSCQLCCVLQGSSEAA